MSIHFSEKKREGAATIKNVSLMEKPEPQKIGKTTYLVSSVFKEQGKVTVVSKISRLIDLETKKP